MIGQQTLIRIVYVALLVLACEPVNAGQSYRVVTVDPYPGMVDIDLDDIDNHLTGVGTFSDGIRVRPFVWDPGGTIRPLGAIDVPVANCWFKCMRINNRGQIGGVRSMEDNYWAATAFQFADTGGEHYAEFPLPWDASVADARLSDSGILLAFSGALSPRTFAIWQTRVYDVSFVGTAAAVGEDGTIGGRSFYGEPFLRRPDGAWLVPWQGGGGVTAIGPSGHFSGYGTDGTLYYAEPDGPVRAQALPPWTRGISPRDINRRGDLVGAVAVPSAPSNIFGDSHGFVYRDGQFVDLNELVSFPEHYIASADVITDTGAILASLKRPGWLFADRQVVLIPIPSPPAAPSGLEFTVTGQTVTLSWRAAPGTTDYIVEAGSVSGASDFFNGPVGPVVSITATLPRGRYFVRLRGRNDAGVGPPSPEVLIDIGSGSSLPGVPRELTWSIVAAGTVRLVWQPVSGATDYSVEAGSTTGTADLFNGSVGAVPGLTARVPAGRYFVRVRASNGIGVGPRSEEVVIDVP